MKIKYFLVQEDIIIKIQYLQLLLSKFIILINYYFFYRFSKDEKLKFKLNSNPGVGSYDINNHSINASLSSPKYTFSKTKKSDGLLINNVSINLQNQITPGPGRYNLKDKSVKHINSPSYSFAKKNENNKIILTPGPGQYDTNIKDIKPKKGGPSTTLSKSKRDFNFSSMSTINHPDNTLNNTTIATPGPGRYQSTFNTIGDNSKKCGVKFDKQERKLLVTNWNKVGPGQYLDETDISGFNKVNTKFNAKFSKSKRDEIFQNQDIALPGPGRYNINNTNVVHKISNAKCFFGEKKENKITLTPGPGQYEGGEIKGIKTKQPGWKFDKSIKSDEISKMRNTLSPGPGRYQGNSKLLSHVKNESGSKFGKEKRLKENINKTPGPGQYYIPCSVRNINDYTAVNSKFEKSFNVV